MDAILQITFLVAILQWISNLCKILYEDAVQLNAKCIENPRWQMDLHVNITNTDATIDCYGLVLSVSINQGNTPQFYNGKVTDCRPREEQSYRRTQLLAHLDKMQ